MKAWIRRLEIILTSRRLKSRLIFGANHLDNKDDLDITVSGMKYMSTLKDAFTVKIKNLTMSEVAQIITGEYYDIQIMCGYASSSANCIFKGGVVYVSSDQSNRAEITVILLCASQLIASYGQKRMNLTLSSNMNIYSAVKFICRASGIPDSNVSTSFKTNFLKAVTVVDKTAANFLSELTDNNSNWIATSDAICGTALSIFDASKQNRRTLLLRDDNLIMSTYPYLTNDGLRLQVMPTFNFMCGDTIKLDNSLIQIPVNNRSEISKNYGYFLDEDGCYMIYEMKYQLSNRSSNFYLEMLCKTRSLVSKLLNR